MKELTARIVGAGTGANWYRGWFLLLLVLIYASSFVDRIIIAVVGQAVKVEMNLSDMQLGLLGGLAFSIFYSLLGLPIARLADRLDRIADCAVDCGMVGDDCAVRHSRRVLAVACLSSRRWHWRGGQHRRPRTR